MLNTGNRAELTPENFMQRLVYTLPVVIFLVLAGYIIVLALEDLAMGGHPWKQGDWLINNAETTVRRGLMGSAILALARNLSLDPVFVTVALQIALIVGTVGMIVAALVGVRHRHVAWLLLLCPGFFVGFWALDDAGGLRKELIAYFAFAVLLFGAARPVSLTVWSYLSAAIFSVAVLAHEGNIFFAPFFGFLYYQLAQQRKLTTRDLIVLGCIVGVACFSTMAISVLFSSVQDYMTVCVPLLNAQVDPTICTGAIKVLETPLSYYLQATFWILVSPRIFSFMLLYALVALFVIGVGSLIFPRRELTRYYFLSALLFLPLYVVAVDWGRWVSFHNTAMIFTMLFLLVIGHSAVRQPRQIAPRIYILPVFASLVVGFSHFVDVLWGGMVWKLLGPLI